MFDHETFHGAVPKPLVALVGAVVSNFLLSITYSHYLLVSQHAG